MNNSNYIAKFSSYISNYCISNYCISKFSSKNRFVLNYLFNTSFFATRLLKFGHFHLSLKNNCTHGSNTHFL